MTFKTNLPAASCAALGGFSLLEVDGPDAAAFLQAQSMNDVAALGVGQWQWNGLLTAKGRVLALFALLREQEDRFLLVLPDHPADELLPLLKRYVFRSKVKLHVDTHRVASAGPVGEPLGLATWGGSATDGIRLDLGAGPDRRTLWLVPAGHPALAPASSATDAHWRAADLAQGFPRLSVSQREAWTPQMLSLDRFGAFSLAKGCYPGQEIVARTHYLGAAKRGLARLRATTPVEPGQAVLDASGRTVGTVVCTAETPCGREALAVVAVDAPVQDLRTETGALERLPLDPGLTAGSRGQR
jgi:folate-binding protein YgfZ